MLITTKARTRFHRFTTIHRDAVAGVKSFLSSALIAVAGGIAGYTVAHIEAVHLLQTQAARHNEEMQAQAAQHVKEILEVRDQYGAKAQDTRESVRQAADGASDAAKAAAQLAEQIAAPAAAARRDAGKAKVAAEAAQDAAARARDAEQAVTKIFPPGYKPPIPDRDPRVPPAGDVPDWLNTN